MVQLIISVADNAMLSLGFVGSTQSDLEDNIPSAEGRYDGTFEAANASTNAVQHRVTAATLLAKTKSDSLQHSLAKRAHHDAALQQIHQLITLENDLAATTNVAQSPLYAVAQNAVETVTGFETGLIGLGNALGKSAIDRLSLYTYLLEYAATSTLDTVGLASRIGSLAMSFERVQIQREPLLIATSNTPAVPLVIVKAHQALPYEATLNTPMVCF
ncbi:MAG: hypothetical protein ACREOO_12380 [bacterium]